MFRLTIASLAAFGVAVLVATRLGGALGNGVLAGFGLGLTLSVVAALFLRHVLRTRPAMVVPAFGASFLVKLLVMVLAVIVFRFFEEAAQRVDWRSFLVAFAAAVALLSPLGSLDVVRAPSKNEVVL